MGNVISIFIALKKSILAQLMPFGFSLGREQYHPESFDSRYVEFQGENQVFQWIWDGRDACFILKYCEDIHKYPFQDWKVISVQPYDVNQSTAYDRELIAAIETPLESFLSEFYE